MFIITFSSARFINKIFYFAKVYVLSLIAMVYEVNYSKTTAFLFVSCLLVIHYVIGMRAKIGL